MNTKNRQITFRVSDEEYDLIHADAVIRKLSDGQTARVIVAEALSGFDQKQETFLRKLDKLEELMEMTIHIASLAVAAGSLPLDMEQHDGNLLREKIRLHINNSNDLGKNILDMVKKGKL